MKNIILYGAPAAGKGSQCEYLVNKLGYVHISMGQLFRDLDDSTEFNRQIHDKIAKGSLIDDETTSQLLRNKLDQIKDKFVVLDGFPRTLNQAKILDTFFDNYIVINIDVEREEALKRVLGRLTCSKCGKIYNIYYPNMTPSTKDTCDICNIKLVGRSDDNEESFNTRFDIYLNNVKDLLDYYKNKKNLYIVKSIGSTEEIYDRIENILKEM